MKIYLAGPDVFFPDALQIGAAKKEICRRYGFQGCWPFDNEVNPLPTPESAFEISRLNEEMIEQCDAVVANLSPFRGVSADPGTVFEIGYAAGLGKQVHGYSWDLRRYGERVRSSDLHAAGDVDQKGHHIENFGLADNLMIEGAIHRRGGIFLAANGDNLELFERVVAELADRKR